MTALPPARKGWCPGALRPMATGDGLLVRIRASGGILALPAARAISGLATVYGNGAIDLTSRANLQIRGVADAGLPELTARLGKFGLLDAAPEAEAIRNIVASPLAGLDPTACLDIRPVVRALEARLAEDHELWSLPPKFGFVVDDGGRAALAEVAADIRFEAFSESGGPRFAVRLGDGIDVGCCDPEAVPEAAAALARAFLRLRREGSERMREVIATTGVATLIDLARRIGAGKSLSQRERVAAERPGEGLCARAVTPHPPAPRAPSPTGRRGRAPFVPVGANDDFLGIGIAFGRLAAADLEGLADLAGRVGAAEIRLTPWRAVLLAGLTPDGVASAARMLEGSGFILSEQDPRLAVSACPGAPACMHASVRAPADAAALAPLARRLAPEGIALHVSACHKGCGQTRATPFTLIGNDGRYDIVVGGTARGRPDLRGLSFEEARSALARYAAGESESTPAAGRTG